MDNSGWGYDRIVGALANLAQLVAKINEILGEEMRDPGTDHFDPPKKSRLATSRA